MAMTMPSATASAIDANDNTSVTPAALNSDGTFSYDPNGQFEDLNVGESETDGFTYTIDDGSGPIRLVVAAFAKALPTSRG